MTAYGCTEQFSDIGHVIWEIRSFNHRYLDTNIRLPEELRMLETEVNQRITDKLRRGKINCVLRLDSRSSGDIDLPVNTALVNKLVSAAQSVQSLIGNAATFNIIDILRWPGVISQDKFDSTSDFEYLMEQFDETLEYVIQSRLNEGKKLQACILSHCQNIATLLNDFKEKLPNIQQAASDKLKSKLQELAVDFDQHRLAQEVLLLIQKSDVTEELDRLEIHLSEVSNVIRRDEPVGRRLDFLMQELNREANTLGAKALSVDCVDISIELKVLIEQMREQIQNIE